MMTSYSQRYKAKVVEFFNNRTQYDKETTIQRALPLIDLVPLSPGDKVLDVATGTGIIALALAQKVGPEGRVVGVDFSSGLLAQAQQKIDELELGNIELVEADAEQVAFEDNSFDAVLCSSALVYLKDIPNVLKQWHSWLKPGGTVAFSAWSEQSYATPLIIEVCAKHSIELFNINEPTGNTKKCCSLLENAGFENIQITQQQQGHYESVDQAQRWDGSWFHPTHNPLENLPEERIKILIAEYAAAIAKKANEQGVWVEKEAFYICGQKPNVRV